MPFSILFVHQGLELYGSDRMLIQSVEAAAMRWPEARITVLLPGDGPLSAALAHVVSDVRIMDLAILRRSGLKKVGLRDVRRVIAKIATARQMMMSYDVTYINTVMVMDYLIGSCFMSGQRLVHVHEIPTGMTSIVFSLLLVAGRGLLVFNSNATRRSFKIPSWQKSLVVWNGVVASSSPVLRAPHATLNVLLIGRFNSWKGQSVLVNAVAELVAEMRSRIRVRLVGGVFGEQVHFTNDVRRRIAECGLAETIEMMPFIADPSEHYAWADVVVVPSIKPEPFGLVAIEGMAAGCCVIASDHGGLSEIVVDGLTGTLVVAGSIESLTNALTTYIEEPALAAIHGQAGRERFAAEFEESHYKGAITNSIADLAAVHAG